MSNPLAANVSLEETDDDAVEGEEREENILQNAEDFTDDLHDLLERDGYDCDYFSDLPNILVVAGVPESLFEEDEIKSEFESICKEFDSVPEFLYLKAFRKVRVVFELPRSAARARLCLDDKDFHGSTIKCYFAQPSETDDSSTSSQFLHPPKPEKQFLISPPGSPPEGWESVREKEPKINYDLVAAITNLTAGESFEVQSASETLPGIVIHACKSAGENQL